MSLLLGLALTAVIGRRVQRKLVLMVPVAAAVVYAAIVFGIGVGRDTPIFALVVLAELGLGAGLFSRYHALRIR